MRQKFKKRIRLFLLFCLGTVMAFSASAQQEVNVNPSKGLMSINIPVHNFDMLDFKVAIGFRYDAKGYQVANSTAGYQGWQLYGSGKITRVLRDLPDEKVYSSGDPRRGWADAIWTLPYYFTINDDGDENVCTDETYNYSNLNYNFPTTIDAQPDLFIVDAPGLSCKLMIDDSGTMKEISSAQDIKIEWLTNGSGDKYFVITNDKGIQYTFDKYSKIQRVKASTFYSVDLFKRSGNLFSTALTYPDTWYLTKIQSLASYNAPTVTYEYQDESTSYATETQNVIIKNNAVDSARSIPAASASLTFTGRAILKKIVNSLGARVEFKGLGTYQSFPDSVKVYNSLETNALPDKAIGFYTRLSYETYSGGSKEWLTHINETANGCTRTLYRFKYYGLLEYPSTGPGQIPINNDRKTDAWGYPNGNAGFYSYKQVYVYPALKGTTGSYRHYPLPGYSGTSFYISGNIGEVNPAKIMLGTISKITYPNGGSSTFEYEPNSFNDPAVTTDVNGGGLRIKAINTIDGIDPTVVNKKEYSYLNDLGRTSGVINKLPTYAIMTPYYNDPIAGVTKTYNTIVSSYSVNSSAYWNHLTVRTYQDMSGGSEVSYAQVTIKETGNGKIKLTFNTPVGFSDLANTTPTYAAEPCTGTNSTFITKAYYQYPFGNIEHRDQQNEQLSESYYNEAGNLLKKIEHVYEDYSASPIKTFGMAIDNNYGILQYSKYHHETYKRLLLQTKETVYDSNLTGNSTMLQTDYSNTAYNREVKTKTITNSDGSKTKTSYTYTGDFANYPLSDIGLSGEAIGAYWLYSKNIKGEILEETKSYAPSGSSTFSTISSKAELFRKNPNAGYNYAAKTFTKVFNSITGVTDFVTLYMAGTGTSKGLLYDPRYEPFTIYTGYNPWNLPSVVREKRHSVTLVNDYLLKVPLLKLTGAEPGSIIFSNFDRVDYANYFTIENPSPSKEVKDSYSGNAYTLLAGDGLVKVISTGLNDKFYKLGFLAKASVATSVNLLINGTIIHNVPIPVSTDFKYYEREFNLTSAGSPIVRLAAVGQIIVDNVIFYPSDAKYMATNYDYKVGKTMEMTEAGMVRKYDYDGKQRVIDVRDINGDILEAKVYHEAVPVDSGVVFSEALTSSLSLLNTSDKYVGRTLKFYASNNYCISGVKYSWSWGDGNNEFSSIGNVNHIYSLPGTYTVSVTLTHPTYGTYTTTLNVVISAIVPLTATLAESGVARMNTCTNQRWYANAPGRPPGNIDAPYSTKFFATVSGCPSGGYEYHWEWSYDGYWWDDYSTTTVNNINVPENYFYGDYFIRCRIVAPLCGGSEIITNNFFLQFNCSVYY